MFGVWAGLVASVATAFALTSADAAPLAAYGQLPTIEQIAISPDGKLLALDYVKGEQREILIEDLVQNKILTGVKVGDSKVRDLMFAGDDHLIITASQTSGILGVMVDRSEWFVASDFNLATHKVRPLLGDVDYAGNFINSNPVVRSINGKPELFVTGMRFIGDEAQATLFRIDLESDRSFPVVDTGGEASTDYMMGAGEKPTARVQYDAPSKHWELDVWQGASWRTAEAKSAFIETPELRGLGRGLISF